MPEISLLYGSLFGLLMAVLSIRIPMKRMTLNVPWGDGGDSGLGTRIRVFGNFIEYVPLILILLALIELSGGEMRVLHGAGTSLIAARLVHAISLQEGENPLWRKVGRGLGAMGTWLILVGLSVYALYLSQS